jgi:hypothetical protein
MQLEEIHLMYSNQHVRLYKTIKFLQLVIIFIVYYKAQIRMTIFEN